MLAIKKIEEKPAPVVFVCLECYQTETIITEAENPFVGADWCVIPYEL